MSSSERMKLAFRTLRPLSDVRASPTQEVERRAHEAHERWPLLGSVSGSQPEVDQLLDIEQKERRMHRNRDVELLSPRTHSSTRQLLGALAGLRGARSSKLGTAGTSLHPTSSAKASPSQVGMKNSNDQRLADDLANTMVSELHAAQPSAESQHLEESAEALSIVDARRTPTVAPTSSLFARAAVKASQAVRQSEEAPPVRSTQGVPSRRDLGPTASSGISPAGTPHVQDGPPAQSMAAANEAVESGKPLPFWAERQPQSDPKEVGLRQNPLVGRAVASTSAASGSTDHRSLSKAELPKPGLATQSTSRPNVGRTAASDDARIESLRSAQRLRVPADAGKVHAPEPVGFARSDSQMASPAGVPVGYQHRAGAKLSQQSAAPMTSISTPGSRQTRELPSPAFPSRAVGPGFAGRAAAGARTGFPSQASNPFAADAQSFARPKVSSAVSNASSATASPTLRGFDHEPRLDGVVPRSTTRGTTPAVSSLHPRRTIAPSSGDGSWQAGSPSVEPPKSARAKIQSLFGKGSGLAGGKASAPSNSTVS